MRRLRKTIMCTALAVATIFGSVFTASAADKPTTEPTAIIYTDKGKEKNNEWKKYEETPVNGGKYSGWSYFCYHEHISPQGKKSGEVYWDLENMWAKIGGKWYYFSGHGYYSRGNGTGRMAANEWIDGYWFNKNGTWTYKYRGSWKHNKTGWWYGDTSGWYAKGWQRIDNQWYYFNKNGYAVSGWQKINGTWYYFYTGKEADVNADKQKYKDWYPYEVPAFSMANDGFVKTTKPGNSKESSVYFFPSGAYN